MSTTIKTIEEIIGEMGEDPKQTVADLRAFKKDTELLASRRDALLKSYPKKWIAVYDGEVRASARSLDDLVIKVNTLKLPRNRVVVRYIDRNVRRMIL
jgi:hypothetical protein